MTISITLDSAGNMSLHAEAPTVAAALTLLREQFPDIDERFAELAATFRSGDRGSYTGGLQNVPADTDSGGGPEGPEETGTPEPDPGPVEAQSEGTLDTSTRPRVEEAEEGSDLPPVHRCHICDVEVPSDYAELQVRRRAQHTLCPRHNSN